MELKTKLNFFMLKSQFTIQTLDSQITNFGFIFFFENLGLFFVENQTWNWYFSLGLDGLLYKLFVPNMHCKHNCIELNSK